MKYYSEKDIQQMTENGASEDAIKIALNVHKKAEDLISIIRIAFMDVKLGNGIGLNEAQGIDDYQDNETIKNLRIKDEKDYWQNIPSSELNRCYSSLCFFDAKGMRFHLPAFIIADIKDEFEHGMAFCLTHISDHSREQFSGLSKLQRNAIKKTLEHMLTDDDYKFDWPQIENAINSFWANT